MVKGEIFNSFMFGIIYTILFIFVFFLLPIPVTTVIFVVVSVILAIYSFYKKERGAAMLYIIIAVLMLTFIVSGLRALSLSPLIIGQIIEMTGLAIAIGLYSRFWWLFVFYFIVLFIAFLYARIAKVISFFRTMKYIGMILLIILALVNILSIIAPQEYENIIWLFGFALPYELYYTVEIAIWLMAGFTTIMELLQGTVQTE